MHQLLLFRFWVFAEHTPSGALGHPLLSGSASIDGIKHSRETTAVHCWASSNYLRASKNLGLPPPTPLRSLVCGTHRLYFEVLGVRAHPLLPGFRICQNALPFGFSHPPAPFRVLGFRTQPLLWLAAAAAPFSRVSHPHTPTGNHPLLSGVLVLAAATPVLQHPPSPFFWGFRFSNQLITPVGDLGLDTYPLPLGFGV